MNKSVFDFATTTLTPKDIKKIRKRLGISQDKLSKWLNLSLATISQWERGTRRISRENQFRLLEMCGYADSVGRILDREYQKTNGFINQ